MSMRLCVDCSEPDQAVLLAFRSLCRGESLAMQTVWEAFHSPLVHGFARWFGHTPRPISDEHDLAAMTLESLWSAALSGRLDDVQTAPALLRVVSEYAQHALLFERRFRRQHKRNADLTLEVDPVFFERLVGREPAAATLAEQHDVLERILQPAPNGVTHTIARRLEGAADDQIAIELGLSRSTVQRRLRDLRRRFDPPIAGGRRQEAGGRRQEAGGPPQEPELPLASDAGLLTPVLPAR